MLAVQSKKFSDITTEHIRGKPFLNRRSIPLTQKALLGKIGEDSVVTKVQSAVPRIKLRLGYGQRTMSYGSGVLISPDGIGLSAFHIYNDPLQKEATSLLKYLHRFFSNIESDPRLTVHKGSHFQGTRDKVIPFLRSLGINTDDVLAGKPLKGQNAVQKLLRKQPIDEMIPMYADIPVLADDPVPEWMRNGSVKVIYLYGNNDDTKISVFTESIVVLGKDVKNDLMLFAIQSGSKHEPFQFAEITDELPVVDEVYYALGHLNGQRHVSLVAGEVKNTSCDFSELSPSKQKRYLKLMSLGNDLKISSEYGSIYGNHRTADGYSGGALCDNEGKVYGILSLGSHIIRHPILEYLGNIFKEYVIR